MALLKTGKVREEEIEKHELIDSVGEVRWACPRRFYRVPFPAAHSINREKEQTADGSSALLPSRRVVEFLDRLHWYIDSSWGFEKRPRVRWFIRPLGTSARVHMCRCLTPITFRTFQTLVSTPYVSPMYVCMLRSNEPLRKTSPLSTVGNTAVARTAVDNDCCSAFADS